MTKSDIISAVRGGLYDRAFALLYRDPRLISFAKERYAAAAETFLSIYGESLRENTRIHLFSTPGRSELSGNHTDHNRGKVIAAAIDRDIIAVAAKADGNSVRITSEGFGEDTVCLDTVGCVMADEKYQSSAIIRGVCDGFLRNRYAVGGVFAYTVSDVPKGSGLSSSAAFEVLVGTLLNHLYNNGAIDAATLAKIAQYAENTHFGKPCGLMDQTACAVGGAVAMDFLCPQNPVIEPLPFDLSARGYALCIVNTGGSHADLNDDYAAIPREMSCCARFFGGETLRGVPKERLLRNSQAIRKRCGDRAFLRALHFCDENDRVTSQIQSIKSGDFDGFLEGVRKSGRSSLSHLQNIVSPRDPREQGLAVALALAGEFLEGKNAAWRVHGGGFAGTIQAFVPRETAEDFCREMEHAFGAGAVSVLQVRSQGAGELRGAL